MGWPARDLPVGCAIDHRDFVRVRDIDEDLLPASRETEALRVCPERNIGDLPASHGVDDGKGSGAIAYEDPVRSVIDADVVSVIAELDLRAE